MLSSLITISLGAILINNFIFSQFLGCCPFLGCSNKVDTAVGMGLAVVFVMGLASAICWVINEYILVALHPEFLQTLAFILVIAALVQFVEMFLKKMVPSLYAALGIFQGLGYTCVLIVMCVVREFLGAGRFGGGLIDVTNGFRFTLDGTGAGIQIFPESYGVSIMSLPFGGFLTLGCLLAVMQHFLKKAEKKKAQAKEDAKTEEKEVA